MLLAHSPVLFQGLLLGTDFAENTFPIVYLWAFFSLPLSHHYSVGWAGIGAYAASNAFGEIKAMASNSSFSWFKHYIGILDGECSSKYVFKGEV